MSRLWFGLLVILATLNGNAYSQMILQGQVTDAVDQSPIPGATVSVTEYRTGAVTDMNGKFSIANLPSKMLLLRIHAIGYSTVVKNVHPGRDTLVIISLKAATVEAGEVVVTGSAFTTESDKSSLPVVPLERKDILLNGSGNFADALTHVAGVSSISSGNAISKPVIRGLGYNRIITINSGLRQEGQQWGDEHGLEIDQFSADRVEIVKGPASLLYGSDALAGVINILEPLPAPAGVIRGEVNMQSASNNKMGAISAMLEGNENGFVWSARGSYRNAGSFRTPDEWIYNSAADEKDGNVFLGLNRKWGFSHLHLNTYDAKLGLVEGERDSATGQFINSNSEIVSDRFSRTVNLPYQRVQHVKISSVNSFYVREGNLRFIAGFQENRRNEFSESTTNAEMVFRLRTVTGDLKYYFPVVKGWKTVVGISSMLQRNVNLGIEFLIPDYNLLEGGGFVSVMKEIQNITLNAGVRGDLRTMQIEEKMVDSEILFSAFDRSFSAWSGSLGAAWKLSDDFNVKLNAGRGFRAPGIAELAANGVHEGTFRYEIGNNNLNPETSLQFDIGADYSQKKFSVELSTYYNLIDNFIYYRNFNGEMKSVNGVNYPVYRFVQGRSVLTGFEASLDFHPAERLHFGHTFSYVYAVNTTTRTPLPFIPPFRYRPELKLLLPDRPNGKLKEGWVKLGADIIASQERVDDFETTTEGAVLFSAGAGVSVKCDRQWIACSLNVTNAVNTTWYDHMSRLKDAGVAGMGRNFVLNITVPFGLRAAK